MTTEIEKEISEKICGTCVHFWSYYEIYNYDEFEPHDCGECHKGAYPYPSNKCGIPLGDTCEEWEDK